MSMQSELRSILLETSARADYQQPLLQAQADEVNLVKLGALIETVKRRVQILSHAFYCMRDGTHRHPMQAFLHATECTEINSAQTFMDSRIDDDEFFSLLKSWGLLCDDATGKRAAPQRRPTSSEMFRRDFLGE